MNCDGVGELLSGYVDGELSPGELLSVERHLRRCHACANEADSLRHTIALISSLDEVEVPADFHANLHQRLVALGPPAGLRRVPAATAWQRRIRNWVLPAATAAAAAAAVLAVGLSGLRPVARAPGIQVSRVVTVAPQVSEATDPVAAPAPVVVQTGPVEPSEMVTQPPRVAVAVQPSSLPDAASPGPGEPAPAIKPPAPVGSAIPDALSAHTASYMATVVPAQSLPGMVAKTYSLSGSVADPASVAADLSTKYNTTVDVALADKGAVASVSVKVSVKDVGAALEYIRLTLGQNVVEEPVSTVDLSASIIQSYDRLQQLEVRRNQGIEAARGLTDSPEIELARVELAELAQKARIEQLDLERLQKQVAESTIRVHLHKPAQ